MSASFQEPWPRPISGGAGRRRWFLFELDDHLHLDRGIAGKSRHADRRAGMLSDGLAEDFDHQIGKSVHHPGLVAETVGRVDHAENLDDALDAIEVAERRAYFSQHDQSRLPGGLVALLHGQVLADLSFERPPGPLAYCRTETTTSRSARRSRSWRPGRSPAAR